MGKDAQLKPATRDYTINLHKRMHRVTFKRKARTAVKCIREFARKQMLTDVFIIMTFNLIGCQNSYKT